MPEYGWRDVSRGGVLLLAGTLAGNVLALLFQALIARHLTTAQYGVVSLGMTLTLALAVTLSSSISYMIRRFVPIYQVEGSESRVRGTLRFGLLALVAISAGLGLIVLLLREPLAEAVFDDAALASVAAVFALAIPLNTVVLYQRAVYQTFMKVGYTVAHSLLLERLPRVLLLPLALALFASPLDISLLYVAALALAAAGGAITMSPRVGPRRGTAEWDSRALGRFLVSILVLDVVGLLFDYSDVLLVTVLLDPVEVGLYNAPFVLTAQSTVILTSLGALFMPLIANAFARGDRGESAALTSAAMRWVTLFTAPLVVFLIVQAGSIMEVVFGGPFVQAAPVLAILAVSNFVTNVLGMLIYVLYAYGQDRRLIGLTVMALGAKVVLGLLLVPVSGIVGAALANLFGAVAIMALRARLLTQIVALKLTDRAAWSYLGCAVGAALVPLTMMLALSTRQVDWLVVSGVAYLATYAALLLRLRLVTIAQVRSVLTGSVDRPGAHAS